MPEITVVHTAGCHLCEDTRAVLAEFGAEYPIQVTLVDAASQAGGALVAAHRPGMYPLVLVDGVFFSHGRLPRRKLRVLLDAQHPAVTR